MTLSVWVVSARYIIFLEGLSGAFLNALLVFYLARTNMGAAAKPYRISCIVTALSSIYTSLLMAIVIEIPLMAGGCFVVAHYGPLLFKMPDFLADFLFLAFICQVHMMWELIPPPAILQYLNLADSALLRRLLLAYSIPMNTRNKLPSDEFRVELSQIVKNLHGASVSHTKVYGLRAVSDNGEYELLSLMAFDVFSSYSASYGLFAFSAYQIRANLFSLGKTSSGKTVSMQRRFFLTQVAQVLMPLVINSFPTGLIAVSMFLGVDLDNFSFFFVYAFWISPSAQAILLLAFVVKTGSHKTAPPSKMSMSQASGFMSRAFSLLITFYNLRPFVCSFKAMTHFKQYDALEELVMLLFTLSFLICYGICCAATMCCRPKNPGSSCRPIPRLNVNTAELGQPSTLSSNFANSRQPDRIQHL